MGCFQSKPKSIKLDIPSNIKSLLFYNDIVYKTERTEVKIPITKKLEKTVNGKPQKHNVEHLDELIARLNELKPSVDAAKDLQDDSTLRVTEIYHNLSDDSNIYEVSLKTIQGNHSEEIEFQRKYIPFLDSGFQWTEINPFEYSVKSLDGE